MATALLPSPSFTDRMNYACFHSNLNSMACFPIHFEHPKCDVKLYVVPCLSIARPHSSRVCVCSKIVSPIMCNGAELKNGRGSIVPHFQRSDTLLDSSSHPLNTANDFEKHLQELFDEVKTLISTGKRSDAIDLLQANYQAVEEQLDAGYLGIEEVAILDIIALGYIALGNSKMVESLLDTMNKIVDCLKDDEMLLDSVLIHMGSMYSSLEKSEKSMLMYQRALKILENLHGKHSIFLVTPLLGLAKHLGSVGRAAEAVEIYERVITIVESSHGADSLDLVLPLSGFGNLLLRQGKPNDAEIPFTRILNLYSRLHGETDGRTGMALCSLAHVKFAQGDAEEAIHLYRKALQVIRDSGYVALDDNIMEKMRLDLAELLHIVGRGNEGRELLEECLVITEKFKGKDHPSLATHFINLATSYSFSKNYVEAERLLRMSLRVMMKSVGPDDPSITFPMLHLAVTLFNLRRDKEAERLAIEVLRIRETAFGKESLPVGEALDCLVSIQTRLGEDDDELLELLKRVLRIQEKEFGYESEEVMITLKKVLFYLDKLGKKQEKFPVQRRLSVLRDKYKHRVQY
ncbi:nephrocystin-3-like [Chenopodium quinoa]|uniref:nephrocystin-3-like n=1 Tax=Chenopodium quinoa TaxID=63459 RepID=UPI000B7855B0|nr:nephrocystin-3-like [Chenopodium quinoa]XP_021774959.1 nephrocystin-3-like [Chenopodium quinoa]XP_021774960.1 nephrocystin-3-like [Chenopodium quinoa]